MEQEQIYHAKISSRLGMAHVGLPSEQEDKFNPQYCQKGEIQKKKEK
jgi:hypothetical protein